MICGVLWQNMFSARRKCTGPGVLFLRTWKEIGNHMSILLLPKSLSWLKNIALKVLYLLIKRAGSSQNRCAEKRTLRAIHAARWIAAFKLTKVTLAARDARVCLSPGRLPHRKCNDRKFLNLWQPKEPPRVCHNTRPYREILPHMRHTRPKRNPQIINATLADVWHAKRQPKSHLGNPSKSHTRTKFSSPDE